MGSAVTTLASFSNGLTADRKQSSAGAVALWIIALVSFFLVLMCLAWALATPVEETTIVTDANGQATFNTIYPGWYQGRATHIHVQVYVNSRSVMVTQIAFPESVSSQIYASGAYASHGSNPTTNASDNVFSDGVSLELASVTPSGSGYTAAITFGVPA